MKAFRKGTTKRKTGLDGFVSSSRSAAAFPIGSSTANCQPVSDGGVQMQVKIRTPTTRVGVRNSGRGVWVKPDRQRVKGWNTSV
ncbi:hypothetical protein GLAREA_06771 [Glarea lozoyensis ATCC 20868]|uniref:Uncharacterized protein n=1 Tax=Glarea lozoyensis (strain ATCC 20868 / MF5171) TaxID=1116229 RepID=S3E5W4_GLAL2|nr:uncharacterized protein GLAREA_06771 [Glarea lozoyensis ATCC 20868]EPE33758.1 hypothetical protein GLAREA_06771 [Glarea lozoyensis ATCC 20868]